MQRAERKSNQERNPVQRRVTVGHDAAAKDSLVGTPEVENKLAGSAAFSGEVGPASAAAAQRKLIDGIKSSPLATAQRKRQEAISASPEATARLVQLAALSERRKGAPAEGDFAGLSETAIQRVEEEPLQGRFEPVQRVEDEEPLQGKFEPVQRVEEEEPLQGKFEPVQRVEEEEPLQGKFGDTPLQRKDESAGSPNDTGLPDSLKAGIESLSGHPMDNVKVHYNSGKPAQLNALAYAQGTDIHVAPGQEQHLPHEAWHIAQQAQGRVQPTKQMKGSVPVNDDSALENEADVMGAKAAQLGGAIDFANAKRSPLRNPSNAGSAVQREVDSASNIDMADITAIDAAADKRRMDAARQQYLDEKGLARGLKGDDGDDEFTVETASDLMGGINDTIGGRDPAPTYDRGIKDAQGHDLKTYAVSGQEQAYAPLDDASKFSAGFGLAAPVLSFYLAVRKLQGGELDKQIEGGFEIASSASSAVKAGADFAVALNEDDATAQTTSAISGSVTDGLNALKAGVLSIKGIYDAYKDATSEAGSSSREKITAGLSITKGLVTSAASTISSLKTILDLFHQGSASIAMAVPGLGIALSAVQIAIDVYEIIKAKTNEAFVKAQLQKNQWESTLGSGKEKRKTQDSNVKIFKEEIKRFEGTIAALKDSRIKLIKNGKAAQVPKVDEKIRSLEISREQAKGQLSALEENVALTSLGQLNVDKQRDSGFSIGVELTKVIAGVLSLVPEPGSQVASVTLKAAAAGASLFKKVGDKIKQAARDRAAADPESFLNRMVDTTRSSEKESERKKTAVKYIFNQLSMAEINNKSEVEAMRNLVAATGYSIEGLGRSFASGGISQAAKDMLKAMG